MLGQASPKHIPHECSRDSKPHRATETAQEIAIRRHDRPVRFAAMRLQGDESRLERAACVNAD